MAQVQSARFAAASHPCIEIDTSSHVQIKEAQTRLLGCLAVAELGALAEHPHLQGAGTD